VLLVAIGIFVAVGCASALAEASMDAPPAISPKTTEISRHEDSFSIIPHGSGAEDAVSLPEAQTLLEPWPTSTMKSAKRSKT
jgi:hypothetical protein